VVAGFAVSISGRFSDVHRGLAELTFVRAQLVAIAPEDRVDPTDAQTVSNLIAALRMACRVVAEHTQRQLQFAIAEDPHIPV